MPHVRALLRTALRLCRKREPAEDLVQETMLRAWKAFGQYQPQTNCKAWLFAILINLWNEEHRKPWARHEAAGAEEFEPEPQANGSTSEERVFMHEVLAWVDHLPEEQRSVLLLAVVEGLTLREIAGILQIPMGTVMSRLGRARAALRENLRPHPGPLVHATEAKLCDAMKRKGY